MKYYRIKSIFTDSLIKRVLMDDCCKLSYEDVVVKDGDIYVSEEYLDTYGFEYTRAEFNGSYIEL